MVVSNGFPLSHFTNDLIYDVALLARAFDFGGVLLARAIPATFERRKTALPMTTLGPSPRQSVRFERASRRRSSSRRMAPARLGRGERARRGGTESCADNTHGDFRDGQSTWSSKSASRISSSPLSSGRDRPWRIIKEP